MLTHWTRDHNFRPTGLLQILGLPDLKTSLAKLIELLMLTHQVGGLTKTRKAWVSQMLRSEPFPTHQNSSLWIWVIWYILKNSNEFISIHIAAQIRIKEKQVFTLPWRDFFFFQFKYPVIFFFSKFVAYTWAMFA